MTNMPQKHNHLRELLGQICLDINNTYLMPCLFIPQTELSLRALDREGVINMDGSKFRFKIFPFLPIDFNIEEPRSIIE